MENLTNVLIKEGIESTNGKLAVNKFNKFNLADKNSRILCGEVMESRSILGA